VSAGVLSRVVEVHFRYVDRTATCCDHGADPFAATGAIMADSSSYG